MSALPEEEDSTHSTQLIALDEVDTTLQVAEGKEMPYSYSGFPAGTSSEKPFRLPGPDIASSSAFPSSSVCFNIVEGAVGRAQRHENRILDEIRAHDEDPMGWLKSKTDDESSVSSILRDADSTLIDLGTPSSEVPEPPPRSRTPSVASSHGSSSSRRPSVSRPTSTPLVPRSSERARSQSPTTRVPTTPSISSAIGLPRSWMSTLGLFSAPRPVPASSSPSAARGTHDVPADTGAAGMSPTQSSLHALFAKTGPPSPRARRHTRFATEGHSPMHAATMPLPTSSSLTSDASPFASHVYIPPSGAPGFTGDHNWNSGGFEFDAEKKTSRRDVRLVGRNEVTIPVLNSVIANAVS